MIGTEFLLSTESSFLLDRLIDQYRKQDQIIIAYDFDDTVSPCYCMNCDDVQSVLRMSKRILNAYLIVYTSNPDKDKIKKFLYKYDIPYDSINENAPFVPFKNPNDKLFYNILLDDKSGLGEAVNVLKTLNRLVLNGVITKENKDV